MNTKILKLTGILLLTVFLSNCNLGLQEEFDFKPEALTENPFENMTALEWIESRSPGLLVTGLYDVNEFDYFLAAIKKAGMEDEYNQITTKERTYLLLNNNAFLGAGDIIQIVTGSATVPLNQTAEATMNRVDTPVKLEKLKTLLRYHMLTTYVLQIPTLFNRDTDYLFQTLIPGDDGLISFRRNVIYQIMINSGTSPLPLTATSEFENVLSHNYQFKNGIGYVIADPVRNRPY